MLFFFCDGFFFFSGFDASRHVFFGSIISKGDTSRGRKRLPLSFVLVYYLAVFVVCGFIVSVTGLASDKLGWVLFMFALSIVRLFTGVLPISYVLDYICIVLS